MKNASSKVISSICALILGTWCFSIGACAKVIEPEIVKTEKWTTSYYIDDDMDMLYPYIQCEADIYNDGTIKLYMWNTHEWDGFVTVKHSITIIQTIPIKKSISDTVTGFTYNTDHRDNPLGRNDVPENFERAWLNTDISYFDDSYIIKQQYDVQKGIWVKRYSDIKHPYYAIAYAKYGDSEMDVVKPYFECYLPELEVPSVVENQLQLTLCPNVDPTGTYNFRLFGHDITITPELLSGNIVAEPELTEQEKYIKQLEEENARLKASITNTNLFGDINGDNLVDVADAQMILNYYVYTLVNDNAESLEEWISKQ